MTVLDQYFQLSDRAGMDESAFQELLDLFADRAEVRPSGASTVQGKEAIAALYRRFFEITPAIQRIWTTQSTENGAEASWAAAGRRRSGEVFAMQGMHVAEFDSQGKIAILEVKVDAG